MVDSFLKLDSRISRMKTYTDKAGQTHKLNTLTKLVYVYIENRFSFFKSQGKEYYDTYKDIAEYWGVEQKAVGESVNKLVNMGLVEKKIIKYRNLPKNVFTKVNPISTTTTNNIPKTSQKPTQNTPTPDLFDYDPDKDDDNEWFPF